MIKLLFPLLLLTLLSCKNENKTDNKISKTLTSELIKISKDGPIKGFSVAIVNNKKVLYQKGFGFSDVVNNKAYTSQSIQNIGSVSKVIIGLSLLKAQEMNLLNLNDPINNYLDFDVFNPVFPNEKITIKQLTNHTSSIIDAKFYDENVYVLKEDIKVNTIKEIEGLFNPTNSHMPMESFLKKILSKNGKWYLKEAFTKFKPGERFTYSNTGAALAAHILEKASGESYSDFTKKHIFQPLAMSSSGWSFETIDFSKHSKLYFNNQELPFYKLQSYPDGGLLTSTSDLAKLLKELINGQSNGGRLLKKESYKKLFGDKITIQLNDSIAKENPAMSVKYDANIFMGKTPTGYFGHTGGDPGIVSLMFFDSKNNIGRILTVNTQVDGSNEKAMNELWTIWNKLEDYKLKLSQ